MTAILYPLQPSQRLPRLLLLQSLLLAIVPWQLPLGPWRGICSAIVLLLALLWWPRAVAHLRRQTPRTIGVNADGVWLGQTAGEAAALWQLDPARSVLWQALLSLSLRDEQGRVRRCLLLRDQLPADDWAALQRGLRQLGPERAKPDATAP
ncbi:protein YgfX [Leeia aquatica]|uniref:Toxin CptA n=1 Tax=Leeia aquatica TaxID=2725557 RepID=A0A847SBC8_9NEIS|nr:protein YgfX [Leeia aquatica]NLR74649.1 hypothetical protein [Leeia aquatica]